MVFSAKSSKNSQVLIVLLDRKTPMLEIRIQDTRGEVNCVLKIFQIFWQTRYRPCLDRLFLVHLEAKIQRKEIMDTRFLRGKPRAQPR